MSTKHTVGPWTHYNGSVWTKAAVDKEIRSNMVCSISNKWRVPDSEKEANGQLISTAPELLDACKVLACYIPAHETELAAKVKAIIAKATGES